MIIWKVAQAISLSSYVYIDILYCSYKDFVQRIFADLFCLHLSLKRQFFFVSPLIFWRVC